MPAGAIEIRIRQLTLVAGDITAGLVQLSGTSDLNVPVVPTEVDVGIVDGVLQEQGSAKDYTIRDVTGATPSALNGFYIVFSSSPTVPGGGAFGTAGDNANPAATGLEAIVVSGDVLKAVYGR